MDEHIDRLAANAGSIRISSRKPRMQRIRQMNKKQGPIFGVMDFLDLWFEIGSGWSDFQADPWSGRQSHAHPGSIQRMLVMMSAYLQSGMDLFGAIPAANPMRLAGLCKTIFEQLHPPTPPVGSTPCEVVHTIGRVRLMRYIPPDKIKLQLPLLLVYSLINRPHILDLQAERSLIRNLLDRGIQVYLIDWGDPSPDERDLTIHDHVNGHIEEMVDFIRRFHRMSRINLMGICMGGTLAVIYAALHPDKVANLITAVTPTQFHVPNDPLHDWLKGMDVNAILGPFGNMPGGLLISGLLLLTPIGHLMNRYALFLKNIEDQGFVEAFFRLERWLYDSPDIPGATFRQFIQDCYQKNLLIQNRMKVGRRRVELKKISIPLLNIFCKRDHFVRPEACAPLAAGVASRDARNLSLDTGHLGLFVSSRWRAMVSRRIGAWLSQRDAPPRRSVAVKPAVAGYAGRRGLSARIRSARRCKVGRGIGAISYGRNIEKVHG